MNYWPSFNTGLHELFLPYIEYYKAYRPLTERIANEYVKEYFPEKYSDIPGDNGFAIGTAAWLYTLEGPFAPLKGHSGPGTGAFTTKLFTDYLRFSMDKEGAGELVYDANLKMSKFLSKMLEEQEDGKLLVKYSASPEQIVEKAPKTVEESHRSAHYYTKGCAFDQQMVYESYKDTVALADELGISDGFVEQIRKDIERLDPVQIGASGQIKEFSEENYYADIGERNHRHVSQLVGLYPGTLINSQTPEWQRGAAVTLNLRGDESTGWSTAVKLNSWARLKNGNRSYDLLKVVLSVCTQPNLWDAHPPFQIDGNLGTTAGIAEMLLQSHEGYIHILPALPDAWSDGSFVGLCARGGFSVSAEWRSKRLTHVKVVSRVGGDLKIYVGDAYCASCVKGGFIERKALAGEEISIDL
jgi:alpha-L-fucosidase 2